MKVACIICEYNPFHNGHKYQIEQIKKSYDAVICIMSGSFMQRGDICIYDKWTRAKAALLSGADLVIELPVCFSLNNAQTFAYGGVSIANSLDIVDALFFGSESGDIKKLYDAAKIMTNESEDISLAIKENMSYGMSFPSAKAKAYLGVLDEDLISEPNNILGIEYIKALMELNSNIKAKTIKRHMVAHHDKITNKNFASASFLRNMLLDSKDIYAYVPDNSYDLYKNLKPNTKNNLDGILRYCVLSKTTDELSKINDVTEGLENRIKQAVNDGLDFDRICDFVKSKRYTLSRIRRILFSIILGLDKDISKEKIEYIRILGMNNIGKSLLSKIKEKTNLSIITKTADFKGFNKSFDKDIYSTDILSILTNQKTGLDFYNSPINLF